MEFNQETLDQLARDIGPEVMPMIYASCHEEIMRTASRIRRAIEQDDVALIEAEAHRLKSSARTIGLDKLADLACAAETSARDKAADLMPGKAEPLHMACQEAIDLIAARL